MSNKKLMGPVEQDLAISLPESGHIYAIVVGIESYQRREAAALTPVDFARNDAEGFALALKALYPGNRLQIDLLVDNDATYQTVKYALKQTIDGLGEDDLFVFYYAGHGFHGAGGNRVTSWESHPFNVADTTLLLRDVLFDRLAESKCKRSLTFIDACAAEFKDLVPARDVMSELNTKELAQFLTPGRYSGIFLSCQPGQKSYPAEVHKHGVWTYFLLQALEGKAENALGRDRYITDTTLRDYLRDEVPRFITAETEFKGQQIPEAIITASNTFVIRHVPKPITVIAPEGDLSSIRIAPQREFFERVDSKPIKRLPGFNKRAHFVPDTVSNQVTPFVRKLLTAEISEEIQTIYNRVKSVFGLKRKDLSQQVGDGVGSLDTPVFRFSIEAHQNRTIPSEYVIVRRLELREGVDGALERIDDAFGLMFDRVVVEGLGVHLDYDDLVDKFEEIEITYGGKLEEEQQRERVTYIAADGMRLVFDLAYERIMFTDVKQSCSKLLSKARRYQFGLNSPSRLLLS